MREIESQFRGGRRNGLVQSSLTGKNPRPRGKLRSACVELTFSDLDIETSQTVTRGEKGFLSSVLQQKSGPVPVTCPTTRGVSVSGVSAASRMEASAVGIACKW